MILQLLAIQKQKAGVFSEINRLVKTHHSFPDYKQWKEITMYVNNSIGTGPVRIRGKITNLCSSRKGVRTSLHARNGMKK